ncbi:CaiB/BaiF CoA-transferase family protein [Oceanicola sp. 22II-s10i]|uniref:CaiB/BaiF CoA transferase family protein n=1 Tax=Oceanicola sp. 22II-s10i TaxID=1317116 RepID=UPI001595DB76|nr:CoA transferase [Oceanicola sp. 22II-s10i]
MTKSEALTGVRVYDASQGVAGPHAAMLMALNGADVIKVEPPGGDWGRVLGRRENFQTIHFFAFNRAKRSIVIDMSRPEGRDLSAQLAGTCDVFVESFRPGVAKRIGLGYDVLSKDNPGLVYLSVSGFGQVGPYRERPGVDGLLQAYSGMMIMNGGEGPPFRQNIIAIDIMTGVYGFSAICAALMRREKTGQGSYLDVNLMQSAAAFQAAKIMEFHDEGGNPPPLYTPSGIFEASDGHILVSAMRDAHYTALCDVVGRPDLATSPLYADIPSRNANAKSLVAELKAEFVKQTSVFWIERLLAAGVMAEKVNSYGDWLEDEHAQAVNAYEWVDHPDFGRLPVANIPGITPLRDTQDRTTAPDPGQHTRDILGGFDLSDDTVEKLIADGIVQQLDTSGR